MSFDFYTMDFYPEESYSRQLDQQVARDEMPYGYTTEPVLREFHPYLAQESSLEMKMNRREPKDYTGYANPPVPGLDQLSMDHPREHLAADRRPKGMKLHPEFPIKNGHY